MKVHNAKHSVKHFRGCEEVKNSSMCKNFLAFQRKNMLKVKIAAAANTD